MRGANRVEGLSESVIREMTRKAKKHDAVNLSQGYPDYPTHEKVMEEAKRAIDEGLNQYSVTWGREKLRKKVAEKLKRFNEINYDPEFEITITCGSSEAIMSTMLGLIEPKDEVLIFQPFYENYVPAVSMASGTPVYTTISREQELDREDIKEKIGKNTKAIMVNTPHNPTGKVFTEDDLRFIRDLCIENDVIAFTDEMYERMIYEGEHISLASLDDMWERTVTIGGFSKVYSVTGWRVGYAAAPKEMMKPIRKAHDYTTVCAPTPFQEGAVKALDLPQDYYENMLEYYRNARDFVYENIKETKMDVSKPQGAYYMLAGIEDYEMNDVEFTNHLVKDKGVAVVPGSSFYHEGGKDLVRFCFSQDMDLLEKAMERIKD
ncbi:MAG: pyridoxal phosphate-dependent aminotransferase [Candidatus Thermoplasmatota archaeon]|nr:pyridoxal phosphate-dependent aminotransferase [Candidatus Thermoplasmatota archaeon]